MDSTTITACMKITLQQNEQEMNEFSLNTKEKEKNHQRSFENLVELIADEPDLIKEKRSKREIFEILKFHHHPNESINLFSPPRF